jgi:hypothetical protein
LKDLFDVYLKGATKVGEIIEGGWYVVSTCVVYVGDKDGDFRLIEVCDYRDDGNVPGNSFNRVWIRNGATHIIPNYLLRSSNKNSRNKNDGCLSTKNGRFRSLLCFIIPRIYQADPSLLS